MKVYVLICGYNGIIEDVSVWPTAEQAVKARSEYLGEDEDEFIRLLKEANEYMEKYNPTSIFVCELEEANLMPLTEPTETVREVNVATIQIVVDEADSTRAADGIAEMLRELLEGGFLIDWSYMVLGGQILAPTKRVVSFPYKEGDAFISP